MLMPLTLDDCSLTCSQREMENLWGQEMRTTQTRLSLLSDLSDNPNIRENWSQDNEEMDKPLISEETSLQGLNHSSRTSGTRKWPNLRLYFRSYKPFEKQTLMKMSDELPLKSIPLESILLTHNSEVPSNRENTQPSWQELKMDPLLQGMPLEMRTSQDESHIRQWQSRETLHDLWRELSGKHRHQTPTDSSDLDDGSTSRNGEGESNKKRCIYQSQLPWYTVKTNAWNYKINENHKKTRETLRVCLGPQHLLHLAIHLCFVSCENDWFLRTFWNT